MSFNGKLLFLIALVLPRRLGVCQSQTRILELSSRARLCTRYVLKIIIVPLYFFLITFFNAAFRLLFLFLSLSFFLFFFFGGGGLFCHLGREGFFFFFDRCTCFTFTQYSSLLILETARRFFPFEKKRGGGLDCPSLRLLNSRDRVWCRLYVRCRERRSVLAFFFLFYL